MDLLTLAMAKKYTDSTRLAYADGGTATFDSEHPGDEMIIGGIYMYLFSKLHPSLEELKGGECIVHSQGASVASELIVESITDEVIMYGVSSAPDVFIIVADKPTVLDIGDGELWNFPSAGMYFSIMDKIDAIINPVQIEFTWGIVKTIDPKFIPTLDYLTLNGTDGKQYKVTVVDGALTVTAI